MSPAMMNETRLKPESMRQRPFGLPEKIAVAKLGPPAKPIQQSAPRSAPVSQVTCGNCARMTASAQDVSSPQMNTSAYEIGIDPAPALSSSSVFPMRAIHFFANSTGEYHRP